MNREILFRGKRIDNGEWVEGGYWLNDTVTRQTPHIIDADGESHAVDPSTVGQYTGLTDKNGTKIFEGDIIKQTNFYDHLEIQGVVIYGKAAQFIIRHKYTEKENYLKCGKTKAFAINSRCEVIGNIHDGKDGQDDKL